MTEVVIYKRLGYNENTKFVKFICHHCKGSITFVYGGVYFPKTCKHCKGELPRVDYLMFRLRRRVCWHVAWKITKMKDTVLADEDLAGKESDPFTDGRGYD